MLTRPTPVRSRPVSGLKTPMAPTPTMPNGRPVPGVAPKAYKKGGMVKKGKGKGKC